MSQPQPQPAYTVEGIASEYEKLIRAQVLEIVLLKKEIEDLKNTEDKEGFENTKEKKEDDKKKPPEPVA